jgi:hypothetical protein
MEKPAPQNHTAVKDIEERKLELERDRISKELALRERELNQKQSEVRWPMWTAIIAGLIALVTGVATLASNVYVTYINNKANEQLARQRAAADQQLAKDKFQSDLILEAIKTGDQQSARNNLKFLLEAGLLNDPQNKIRAALDKKNLPAPTLPSINKPFIGKETTMEFVLTVQDAMNNPVPKATVSCDGDRYQADSNGQVRCTLPAGTQSVEVTATGPDGSSFAGRKPTDQHTITLTKPNPDHR